MSDIASNAGGILGGGALALIIIREVFSFVSKRNGKAPHVETSGEKPPEFWTAQMGLATSTSIRQEITPILTNQVAILRELQQSNASMSQNLAVLTKLVELQMNSKGD